MSDDSRSIDLEDENEEEFESEELEEINAIVGENDLDDGVPSASDEEDDFQLEDPDDMDEDLELPEERISTKPAPRTQRKRVVNYYQDTDEMEDTPEPKMPVKRSGSQRPQDLDPDLILTDEETEYNPANHASRMTERQRRTEADALIELDNSKKQKIKAETEEEAALRKAESARRRNDYKNKQLEEEKRDTLNKLLKRRAAKTKTGKIEDETEDTSKALKPLRPYRQHPGMLRYVDGATATTLSLAI